MIYKVKFNNTLDLGNGRKVNFRPWTTKEEKEYLLAKQDDRISEKEIFEILIKPCLETPIVLTNDEMKYLIIKIREKSIGETFKLTYECQNCKTVNSKDIKFSDAVKFKPSNFKEITVEDVTIKFGPIKSQTAMEKIFSAENKIDELIFNMVFSTEKIVYEGDELEAFKTEDLLEFYNSLPTSIMDELANQFIDMIPETEISTKTKCFKCKDEKEWEINAIPNFLWE